MRTGGIYEKALSTTVAYEAAFSSTSNDLFSLFENNNNLRLAGVECFFCWHASRGYSPTASTEACVCCKEAESKAHLLIHCSVPRVMWTIIDSLNITPDDYTSLTPFMLSHLRAGK